MAPNPEPLQQVAIALGSNLGDSRGTLEQALATLDHNEAVRVVRRSSWYRSAPIGPVQPDYVNGCALLEVSLAPEALLDLLQATENRFGRVRAERWGPRTLDLELHQRRTHRQLLAGFAVSGGDATGHRGGQLHRGLVGHDVGDDLVLGDGVADLDMPGDQFGLGRALAHVGQFEAVTTHPSALRS